MSGAVETIETGGAIREDRAAGLGPYTLARRRLLRNRPAMVSLAVFLLIVVACACAPIYAHHIAHVDPFQSNVNGTTIVNGKRVAILQQGGGALGIGTTPIGPSVVAGALVESPPFSASPSATTSARSPTPIATIQPGRSV